MPRRAAISLSAPAMSKAWVRLSSTHGPAISASGKALPNRALPMVTVELGLAAITFIAADHEGRNRLGQPAVYCTAENAVGLRNALLMLAMIGPSVSLSSRALIQAGSARNASHTLSRSASD